MWLQADHLLSLGVGPSLSPRPLKIFLQVSKHPSSHFYKFPTCLSSTPCPRISLRGPPLEGSASHVPFVAWLRCLAQVLHLTSCETSRHPMVLPVYLSG